MACQRSSGIPRRSANVHVSRSMNHRLEFCLAQKGELKSSYREDDTHGGIGNLALSVHDAHLLAKDLVSAVAFRSAQPPLATVRFALSTSSSFAKHRQQYEQERKPNPIPIAEGRVIGVGGANIGVGVFDPPNW